MASTLKRIADLDIHQDLAFQRRSWILQRAAWWLLAALAIGALIGVFGHGPISRGSADDSSLPFSLEFDRFSRYRSPLLLRIHVKREAAPHDSLRLWVSREYLGQVQITAMTPQPFMTQLSSTGATYQFPLTPPFGGTISVHLEADHIGRLPGTIGLSPDHSLSFTQWIYP